MKLMRIGVDLAKNVFQIHGVDCDEKPVWRQRLPRDRWLHAVLDKLEPGCVIGMESCGGAHHWARQLQARGYQVRLLAPQFVKPYVKSNKNDANDAEAICEAMSRPSMRFVAIKTIEQQDIQATHRIRAGLIEQRTAKANQIRGLVTDRGHSQLARASRCLGNFYLLDRRREVRPRRHPIPQLVEILRQIPLEIGDGFIVNAGSTAVGPDLLVGVPYRALRYVIRFRRAHAIHPRRLAALVGWITPPLRDTQY